MKVVEINLRSLVLKADLESKRFAVLEKKEAAVLADEAKYEPAREVHRIEARVKLAVNPVRFPCI